MRIGVISDTHGLLRPEAVEAFARVDHILHAGDIGGEHILSALRSIAPVTEVLGNVDGTSGHDVVRVELGGLRVLLTHVLPRPSEPTTEVARSLGDDAADLVVFGHSHLPHDEHRGGVWYLNPASAGPRRFDYPVSVAILEQKRGKWTGWHVPLDERSKSALEVHMNQMR